MLLSMCQVPLQHFFTNQYYIQYINNNNINNNNHDDDDNDDNSKKLAPYKTDGRLFATDVSAKFKVA